LFLPCARRKRICSPKTPRLLSYLLGDKVNIVTLRKDQAMAIREEYHAFRKRAVWLMGVAPMLLYLGMKRADHVVTEGHSMSLAPPLLTGTQCVWGREGGGPGGQEAMWWLQHGLRWEVGRTRPMIPCS